MLLAACAKTDPVQTNEPFEVSLPTIPAVLSSSGLLRLPYTITDTTVRSELTRVGLDFSIKLKNGSYRFASPRSVFQTVRADKEHIVYGDLNGDEVIDVVVPLMIGEDYEPYLELAAVKASGSGAVHFASFPLGQASLKSITIMNGKIRVNYVHTVSGDPGPRNTELFLELPK